MRAVRSILFVIVFILVFLVFKAPVFAQTPTSLTEKVSNTNPLTTNTNPEVEVNLHNWTQNVMIEVISALSCQLAGVDPTNTNLECLGIDPKTGKIGYVNTNGGLLGLTTRGISYLYIPPVHTLDYVAHLVDNFGFAKKSYAQGFGFNSLNPLVDIWVVFRNLVYVLFAIVTILIGIAIMFRVKIDPRTVMTIQNQIPKIVLGLILVTFSLAIAGLLIDLMFVASYLLTSVIASADPSFSVSSIVNSTNPINAANATIPNGFPDLSYNASNAVGGHLGDLFDNPPGRMIVGAITGILGLIAGASIGSPIPILGSIIGGAVGSIVGGLLAPQILGTVLTAVGFLVIVVAIIASLFRLWFQLLLAYISILVDIIFAPFWIIAGLLPGSKINFSAWIRNLMGNLAAFPAVLVMFTLTRVIINSFNNADRIFVAPLIGSPGTVGEIGSLIGLGFILAMPSVVKLTKSMFGAPQIGFGPILGGVMTGVNVISLGAKPILPTLYSRHWNPNANNGKGGYQSTGLLSKAAGAANKKVFGRVGKGISVKPTIVTYATKPRQLGRELRKEIRIIRKRVTGKGSSQTGGATTGGGRTTPGAGGGTPPAGGTTPPPTGGTGGTPPTP